MELEKIERIKELIDKRDELLSCLETLKDIDNGMAPRGIAFQYSSGYDVYMEIPNGTIYKITNFLKKLVEEELDGVNNWILNL